MPSYEGKTHLNTLYAEPLHMATCCEHKGKVTKDTVLLVQTQFRKKRPAYTDKMQISFLFTDDSLQDYTCNFLCGLIWLSLAKLAYLVPPTPFYMSSSSWDSYYPIKCHSKSAVVIGCYSSPLLKSGVCLNLYNVHSILTSCPQFKSLIIKLWIWQGIPSDFSNPILNQIHTCAVTEMHS